MDETELNNAIGAVVDELSGIAPEQDWSSVTHLLYHGEEGEAMDVLIATLVRFNVPISAEQRRTIGKLRGEFGLTDDSRRTYRYLGDSEMLDRMTVVDDPS